MHPRNRWVVGTPHRKIGYGQNLRRQRSKTHVGNQSPIKRKAFAEAILVDRDRLGGVIFNSSGGK
jgi:hypothetical protein